MYTETNRTIPYKLMESKALENQFHHQYPQFACPYNK